MPFQNHWLTNQNHQEPTHFAKGLKVKVKEKDTREKLQKQLWKYWNSKSTIRYLFDEYVCPETAQKLCLNSKSRMLHNIEVFEAL